MKELKKLCTAIMICVVSVNVAAFDMNPIDVHCWGKFTCTLTDLTEKLKFPVHETMTLLAYDNYTKPESIDLGAAKKSSDNLQKKGRLRDLVIGSEWNDDPDSLLKQGITSSIQWFALFRDAESQAKCKKSPDRPECNGKKITNNPMMLYRSHFGDLQFLHSMASTDDERAYLTKQKMMAWAKFTYSVFISKENLEKYAIDSKKITSFSNIANLLQKPGWTVGALFDPVPGGEWVSSYNPTKLGRFQSSGKPRQQNSYDDPEDSISIRYVALGSLLHMIQDSYSDSHTDRGSCGTLFRNKGKIRSFRNYANQKADDHGIADVQPEWLESGLLTTDNPIWASAKIIQFASKKTAWEEGVEEFLDKEVFFLEDPQKLPEPGSRECFEGRDWN